MEKKSMKAALKTAEGTFEVQQVDQVQIPAPDWVLLRILTSGICGTDLRHWKKEEPHLECRIMGHELAGIIVEVGEEVTNVKPGDRVVVETLLGDGTCDWCRVQQYNLCPNLYKVRMETVSRAFAEYLVGPATKFHKLPDHVSYQEATLLDSFAVSLHAQQLSGLKINDKVFIIGAGPIGLGQLQLAKISGADVIIADVIDSSLRKAKELGADEIVNIKNEDIYERVMDFTQQRGADVCFECAGGTSMEETLAIAVSAARIGGTVVIVGGFEAGKTKVELEWQQLQMKEIRLIPSASYSFWGIYPEIKICLDLLSKGKLNAKAMINHEFSLDQINEAFETALHKEETEAIFVVLNN
jgi:L-iditol 2-dehydrogenase